MQTTRVREITDRESSSKKTSVSWSWREVAVLVTKMLLKDPTAPIGFRVMSLGEQRCIRPPRLYELPAFHDGMRHCTSDAKYLRPTLYCSPVSL